MTLGIFEASLNTVSFKKPLEVYFWTKMVISVLPL